MSSKVSTFARSRLSCEAANASTLKMRGSDLGFEENLAFVQTILGENSRAISTLTQLLQTPYTSWLYNPAPITPALLRLDPIWDPLRADPAFQKLCEEKATVKRDWEIIADNLSKVGWSWSCVATVDRKGRTIWIADRTVGIGRGLSFVAIKS
jgi:hypothetical protein